ncbi:hypothetical protein [[Leptolyngbya] sp. PCC 7376]|uniref:hypothetical protein n=1 Tax=[Leptolyngbya] sp. PCC 7376 TaxID=111781 RepID=UPI0005A0D266|nr:hypothetical protein [[Leptolyngbya] sp. PCC 7376]
MSEAFKDFLNYFEGDRQPYPWTLNSGAIADDLERELEPISEMEEADLANRSQRFFENLEPLIQNSQGSIETTLFTRIGNFLPRQQCLDILKICQEKRDLAKDFSEQLQLAIADLLPQWNGEDRAILMRSYAGAFRGGVEMDSRKLTSSNKSWEAMSAVEQAQYVVAIADFVLTELNETDKTNR